MVDDDLSNDGIKALRVLRDLDKRGDLNNVLAEPGWFWSLPPCGPGAIRELERLHLAKAMFFPDEKASGKQRLAVQLTPSGKKMRLPEPRVEPSAEDQGAED